MSIKITLEFEGYDEAAAVLLALGADTAAGKPVTSAGGKSVVVAGNASAAKTETTAASSQPAAASAKTTAKDKTSPAASGGKATSPTPPPSPTPAPAAAASTSLRDKPYPETGIPALLNGYAGVSKENRGLAVKVLAALGGATNGPSLKPEFYDAAHKAFTLLAGGTDPEVVLAGLAGGEEDGGLG